MSKLYSSDHIIKALLRHGFVFVFQRGSHVKLHSIKTPIKMVIIPADRKQIPIGTFRSILRQAGVDKNIFE